MPNNLKSVQLSEHFSLAEMTASQFATRHGLDNTPGPSALAALEALCQHILEPLRAHFKRPVRISSGYRAPAVNAGIGGASSSQHKDGEAADLTVPGVPNIEVARWVRDNLPFDQVIMEGGWVHVSYDPSRNRRQALTAIFKSGQPTRYRQGL